MLGVETKSSRSYSYRATALGLESSIFGSSEYTYERAKVAKGRARPRLEQAFKAGVTRTIRRLELLDELKDPTKRVEMLQKAEHNPEGRLENLRVGVLALAWNHEVDPDGLLILERCRELDNQGMAGQQAELEQNPTISEDWKALYPQLGRANLSGQDYALARYRLGVERKNIR